MVSGGRASGRAAAGWLLLDLLVAGLSLFVATSRRMQFLDAPWDDQLFARLANSLRDGNWLGPYDKLTLIKGPGFSAFLAATSAAGIPLRLAEQAVYLVGCWLVAHAAGRLSGRRWLCTVMFAAAALNPILWGRSLDRVVRENLYLGLTVLVLGLAALLLVPRRQQPAPAGDRAQGDAADRVADGDRAGRTTGAVGWTIWLGVLLGLALGWFWLTREEGVWIVPPLAVLALDWLVRRWRACPRAGRLRFAAAAAATLLVPVVVFAAVDLGVASINQRFYGVLETNEFRSKDFAAAYGALSRIQHDHWRRLVPVPHDARERAYAVSPAARRLAPSLDGPNGKGWTAVGCSWVPLTPCDDMQAAWFIWALRDAAEAAQQPSISARNMERLYRQIAEEVNAACDRGAIPCLPARSGFTPPLRREYVPFVLRAAWDLASLLARLGDEPPEDQRSEDSPAATAQFRRVALGPWVPPDAPRLGEKPNDVRLVGWAYAPGGGRPDVRVTLRGAEVTAPLQEQDAPDIVQAVGSGAGTAVRFEGIVRCGDDPCRLEVDHDGRVLARDLLVLSSSSGAASEGMRLWLDKVEPLHPVPARLDPARAVAAATSHALRSASVVLMPLAAALVLVLAILDLRARKLRPLTTLWLALLGAIAARIALLAVLEATSMPAVNPLYLSPAVGIGLLLTAGVLSDAAVRLTERRSAFRRASSLPALDAA